MNEFKSSPPVMVRSYNTDTKWVPGQVTKDLGRMHYDVNVDGRVSKRHVDQLRPYTAPDPEMSRDQSSMPPVLMESREDTLLDESDCSHVPSTSPEVVNRRVFPARGTRGIPPERLDL